MPKLRNCAKSGRIAFLSVGLCSCLDYAFFVCSSIQSFSDQKSLKSWWTHFKLESLRELEFRTVEPGNTNLKHRLLLLKLDTEPRSHVFLQKTKIALKSCPRWLLEWAKFRQIRSHWLHIKHQHSHHLSTC